MARNIRHKTTYKLEVEVPFGAYYTAKTRAKQRGLNLDAVLAQVLHELLGVDGSHIDTAFDSTHISSVPNCAIAEYSDIFTDSHDMPSGRSAHLQSDADLFGQQAPQFLGNEDVKQLETLIDKCANSLIKLRESREYDSVYGATRAGYAQTRAEVSQFLEFLPASYSDPVFRELSLSSLSQLLENYIKICRSELNALVAVLGDPAPEAYTRMLKSHIAEARNKDENKLVAGIVDKDILPFFAGDLATESRLKLALDPRNFSEPQMCQSNMTWMTKARAKDLFELEYARKYAALVENYTANDPSQYAVALDLAQMPARDLFMRKCRVRDKHLRQIRKPILKKTRVLKAPHIELPQQTARILQQQQSARFVEPRYDYKQIDYDPEFRAVRTHPYG